MVRRDAARVMGQEVAGWQHEGTPPHWETVRAGPRPSPRLLQSGVMVQPLVANPHLLRTRPLYSKENLCRSCVWLRPSRFMGGGGAGVRVRDLLSGIMR